MKLAIGKTESGKAFTLPADAVTQKRLLGCSENVRMSRRTQCCSTEPALNTRT